MNAFLIRVTETRMGVVVSSGRGDGEYPVYVKRAEIPDWFPGPRVQEVRIIFF